MTVKELEKRVKALEAEVKQLKRARAGSQAAEPFDWESTVDKFKNDADILEVLSDAMKLREDERRAVRKKRTSARRTSQ
jgi:hypothetical protein